MAKRKTGKRRGGQPGNKNAQRHGIYSELYTTNDAARLAQPSTIEDEQTLVRKYIYQIASWLEMDKKPALSLLPPVELPHFSAMLDAIETVNSCERTILLARGRGGDIGKTILDALAAMDPDDIA